MFHESSPTRRGLTGQRSSRRGASHERPVTLAVLCEGFLPEMQGGMMHVARDIARGLADRGVAVTVVTRALIPGLPSTHVHEGLPVERVGPSGLLKGKGFAAALPLALFTLRIWAWLLRRRPDAVLTIGVKVLPFPVLAARPFTGLKALFHAAAPTELTEPISRESLGAKRNLAERVVAQGAAFAQRALKRGDACLATSSEIESLFAAAGVPEEKIVYIPNGVEPARFVPATPEAKRDERRRLGLPQDRPIVLFTGRLSKAKGLLTLFDAWQAVTAAHPEALLVCLGAGGQSFDDCGALLEERAASPGLRGKVLLPGNSDEPQAWLRAADLFVFPSEYEGFGLSLVEAALTALPIVTTKVGAAEEVVGREEAGLYVPIGDAGALANALKGLLDDPARWPVMGRAGRARAASRFSLDAVAERYLDLLDRELGRPRRGDVGDHRRAPRLGDQTA